MIAVLVALGLCALFAPPVIHRMGTRGFYLLARAPAGALIWVIVNWPRAHDPPRVETIRWVDSLDMNIVLRFDTLAAVMSVLIPPTATMRPSASRTGNLCERLTRVEP